MYRRRAAAEALAPDLGFEQARHVEREMRRVEAAVGLDGAQPRLRGSSSSTVLSKAAAKRS